MYLIRRKNYVMLYLTGQKRGMSELNLVWPVILTGIHAVVISSPALTLFIGFMNNILY